MTCLPGGCGEGPTLTLPGLFHSSREEHMGVLGLLVGLRLLLSSFLTGNNVRLVEGPV